MVMVVARIAARADGQFSDDMLVPKLNSEAVAARDREMEDEQKLLEIAVASADRETVERLQKKWPSTKDPHLPNNRPPY